MKMISGSSTTIFYSIFAFTRLFGLVRVGDDFLDTDEVIIIYSSSIAVVIL